MEKKEMLPLRSQAGGAHAYCILHSTHTFNATFEIPAGGAHPSTVQVLSMLQLRSPASETYMYTVQ